MTTQTQISGGPSKFDLMVSLFDGDQKPWRTVRFGVDSGRRNPVGPRNTEQSGVIYEDMDVSITAIEREGDYGESWFFQGQIANVSAARRGRIHGHYSTKTRSGWFTRSV